MEKDRQLNRKTHESNGTTEPTDDKYAIDERVWEDGWEGHEQRQRERLARLPLTEKLAWLEETHRLVLQLRGKAED
jgi:hypothetical protein